MTGLLIVRDRDFSWSAREVLREADAKLHLLLRIDVHGPHFPERDTPPFVRLAVRRRVVFEALMTDVDDSQTELRGYFPTDLPLKGRIEFGYGSEVLGSLTIGEPVVDRLDEGRIDEPFHRVTLDDRGAFAALER